MCSSGESAELHSSNYITSCLNILREVTMNDSVWEDRLLKLLDI